MNRRMLGRFVSAALMPPAKTKTANTIKVRNLARVFAAGCTSCAYDENHDICSRRIRFRFGHHLFSTKSQPIERDKECGSTLHRRPGLDRNDGEDKDRHG